MFYGKGLKGKEEEAEFGWMDRREMEGGVLVFILLLSFVVTSVVGAAATTTVNVRFYLYVSTTIIMIMIMIFFFFFFFFFIRLDNYKRNG